jgi:hypothetical protein
VLRLADGERGADAFFDLPAYSGVEQGLKLGLVTMGIGVSVHHAKPPATLLHTVTVSGLEPSGATFLDDNAATWCGVSDAALLFVDGGVVGMHQEVLE